jgi:hypothetical protein
MSEGGMCPKCGCPIRYYSECADDDGYCYANTDADCEIIACRNRVIAALEGALAAAQLEIAALRLVVEAAQPIVRWTAGNFGDGVCDELDHWDLAIAALDSLRSGKPREEAAETEPGKTATTSQ